MPLRSFAHRSLTILLLFVFGFAILGARQPEATSVKVWKSKEDFAQWKPLAQVELEVTAKGLILTSTGGDPHMIADISAPAGWKKLIIKAAFKGTVNSQIFWTTTKNPGTSEGRSVRFKMVGRGESVGTYETYFYTEDSLSALRIDPDSKEMRMRFESIEVVTSEAPPAEQATDPNGLVIEDGFRVELLYSVPKAQQGSWVSMTTDPKGRLIVCDQYGGLFRVTPPPVGETGDVKLEKINIDLGEAQGLLYGFDALYVVVNHGGKYDSGLYKVTDSDGDDQFDQVSVLKLLPGRGGEHGPHSIVLSPDKKSLYVVAGNNTTLPEGIRHYRLPNNWGEDQLLPRQPCSNGHNTNVLAPGGWVCQVSPDGKDWDLLAAGFRNPFDIAFNKDGELFTYDADMEMDVGTPWYRPTRICHVVSGGEFGWRFGTGKWLPYFTDNLPPVVDVGQGSPTGITFGYGADFPEYWQDTLFVSDWTYGKLYSVKLSPEGSSYSGELNEFLTGIPLPLTDVIVNPYDGAMYITIGGRRTQSGLYRVTYIGDEEDELVEKESKETIDLRAKRHELEQFHGVEAARQISKVWKALSHSDRHIRYAARIALEHQPVEQWAPQALQQTRSDPAIQALLALLRSGDDVQKLAAIEKLMTLDTRRMDARQQLDWLRALNVGFARTDAVDDGSKEQLGEIVQNLLPVEDEALNHEVCRMLVYLRKPSAISKFIPRMQSARTQEDLLFYGMTLRVAEEGWSNSSHETYLSRMNDAEQAAALGDFIGGGHYQIYVQRMREDFVASLSGPQQEKLDDFIHAKIQSAVPTGSPTPRKFIKNWKIDDLLTAVTNIPTGRSYEIGKRMFTTATCIQCHRFGNIGGILGPDITGAARRYSAPVLLREIVEPSVQVSDQFRTHTIITLGGKIYQGRILDQNDEQLTVAIDPKAPSAVIQIKADNIDEILLSKTSMMPLGLLNTLTREEILDLLAYIQSGGDPEHALFE